MRAKIKDGKTRYKGGWAIAYVFAQCYLSHVFLIYKLQNLTV